MKKIFLLVLLITLTFVFTGCDDFCDHVEEVWEGVEPSCCNNGWTNGVKCSKCGKVLEERQPLQTTDHHFGEYEDFNFAKHCKTCKDCETKEYENHIYDAGTIIEENQETGKAKTKFTCTVCGHEEIVEHSIGAIVFPPVPLG